jgi:hypothetical protein
LREDGDHIAFSQLGSQAYKLTIRPKVRIGRFWAGKVAGRAWRMLAPPTKM